MLKSSTIQYVHLSQKGLDSLDRRILCTIVERYIYSKLFEILKQTPSEVLKKQIQKSLLFTGIANNNKQYTVLML